MSFTDELLRLRASVYRLLKTRDLIARSAFIVMRWPHRALAPDFKNRILLENYFLPGGLEIPNRDHVENY